MLTSQTLPSTNPKHGLSKKFSAALIIVAVIVTVFTTCVICSPNQTPRDDSLVVTAPYSVRVLSGPIFLNPTGIYVTGFSAPEGPKTCILQGNFTVISNCTNNAITVTIWSQQAFVDWIGCKSNAVPLYNRDMFPMISGTVNMTLPSGIYIMVFSSASMEPKTVAAQFDLNCPN
jgi:hypothetical protein